MYTQHTHTHTHIHCMRLQWLHCLSPTLHENSGCSTCLPTLDVLSLFNNSYSSISVVTLYILCAWIIFNFFFFKLRYGLPCGSAGIESACNAGDLVQSLGWEDPLENDLCLLSVKMGTSVQFSLLPLCLWCYSFMPCSSLKLSCNFESIPKFLFATSLLQEIETKDQQPINL